jgi:lipopolysaccharide exporter
MPKTALSLPDFSRNFLAYGASEVAAKGSRLLVVIAVSRTMDVTQIGVAAAALASGDILKSLTENGAVQRVIAAPADDLEAQCNTARRIFWVWCGGLFLLQLMISAVLALVGNATLGILLALLALEYLFMPAGLVQAALAMREGKMQQTAAIAGGQVVGANLMSVVLSLTWPSALVLVLPRVFSAPIWLFAMRRLRPWTPDPDHGVAPLRPFLVFGWAVLTIEVVKTLRLQADKILVGVVMGAEMLGLYFMAFNAGLSLSTSLSRAFSVVLFPHLCMAHNRADALRQGIILALGLTTPVILLQAWLAPYYVPLLFGPGWENINGVVSVLCLVAIPSMLWSAAAGWLRARNQPTIELAVTVILTVALMFNIVLLAPLGLLATAKGYLAVCIVVMTGASLPAIAEAFGRKPVRI